MTDENAPQATSLHAMSSHPDLASCPSLKEIRAAIPRALFQSDDRRAARFALGVFLGVTLCQTCAWFLWSHGLWFLYPLTWLMTGTLFFSLFEIAHNCGHNAFFTTKRANRLMGHIAALPLIYPFTQWKLWHDAHHRRPNVTGQTIMEQFQGKMHLSLDTAFAPLDTTQAQHAKTHHKFFWLFYRMTRSVVPIVVFLTPFLLSVLFTRDLRPQDKRDCRVSLLFTLVCVPTLMIALYMATQSFIAIIHFWLAPLFVYSAWLAYYAFLQHTGENIPVFRQDEWTNQAQFLAVVNTRTPKLISWLHGGGEFHAIHHIAPTIPNYHLEQAYEALLASEYAPYMKDIPFSLTYFLRVQRTCLVWDGESHTYRTSIHSP